MAVEVILKKPVAGLGAEADLVKVKSGYARNYLVPRDLAAPATATSKTQMEKLKARRAEREAQELNDAQAKATALKKVTVTFQMETAETGRVFGSITNQNIAERLAQMGHEVDRRKIVLPRPVKEAGTYDVGIQLGAGITATIKVVVDVPATEAAEAEEEGARKKKPARAKSAKAEAAE